MFWLTYIFLGEFGAGDEVEGRMGPGSGFGFHCDVHGMSDCERKSSAGLDEYFESIRSTANTAKIAEIQ